MKHSAGMLIVLAAVLLWKPLSAQSGERTDPHLRNDCRLAAQVLRTGNPAPRREWALDAIRRCDVSGPDVISDLWRNAAPSDPGALGQLWNATRHFNDRRIVDAVAEVALRKTAPDTTRIFAFTLLFSYAHPGAYVDEADLLDPGETPPPVSSRTHDTRMDETRARLGGLRPEVAELLETIAAQEPGSRSCCHPAAASTQLVTPHPPRLAGGRCAR